MADQPFDALNQQPLDSARLLDAAHTLMAYIGVPNTPTNLNQLVVLLDAWAMFIRKNKRHHDLWKQFGWHDSALHIRSKAARVALVLRSDLDVQPEDVLREIPDLINYSVFFLRNVREA